MSEKSTNKKSLVSIVCPIYNEEKVIPELLRRLQESVAPLGHKYSFEFVFVNDGSKDKSLAVSKSLILSENRLKVIELRKNYGQTAALQAGLNQALGEIIISMDADLQHFPEEIPNFINKIEEGFDVVCGWRADRQEGIIRRWPSKMANYLLRRVSGLTIHDIGTTFRAYRSEVIQDVLLLGENHRFVPIFAHLAGAKIEELPITNIERPVGQSNYGISRTLNVFLDLFFLFFLVRYFDRPIRFFGKISLLLFIIASIIGTILLVLSYTTGTQTVREHSGWFMLSALLALASLQVLMTGIISEVLARVYYKSSGQTSYKIRCSWDINSI